MEQRLLVFILLFSMTARGQDCLVHLDKPFYMLGETIWYGISLPANISAEEGLLEVKFLFPNGEVAESYHLAAQENAAAGHQGIGYDWPEGMYTLQCRVHAIDSDEVRLLAAVLVPVYNDLADPPAYLPVKEEKRSTGLAPENLQLQVKIALERPVLPRRGEVKAVITVTDKAGNPVEARLSVSVIDDAMLPTDAPVVYQSRTAAAPLTVDTLIRFAGQALDSGKEERVFSLGAFVLPLDSAVFARSDANGQFDIALPVFFGSGSVQFDEVRAENLRIIPTAASAIPTEAGPLPYSETVIRYLQLSRQRKKIYQLFNTLEMPVSTVMPVQKTALYPPDRRFPLDDFLPMEDLPRFFTEVPAPLKFRREKDRHVAKIFNPDPNSRGFYAGSPLFIVDGRLTRDADWIGNLDIKQIERIDLFYTAEKLNQRFQSLGRYGLVIIRSRVGSLQIPEAQSPNLFPVYGLQPPAPFPAITEDPDLPAFRPQTYWNPGLTTGSGGQASLQFTQGDAKSRFSIQVVARGKNGETGTGTAFFEVRE